MYGQGRLCTTIVQFTSYPRQPWTCIGQLCIQIRQIQFCSNIWPEHLPNTWLHTLQLLVRQESWNLLIAWCCEYSKDYVDTATTPHYLHSIRLSEISKCVISKISVQEAFKCYCRGRQIFGKKAPTSLISLARKWPGKWAVKYVTPCKSRCWITFALHRVGK